VDCIGSFILGGKVKNHFNILTDFDYYNLSISPVEVEEIYQFFRCKLTPNGVINQGVILSK
jgi:hypothetical protein